VATASILVSEADSDVRRLLTALLRRSGHEAIVLGADVAVPPRADLLLVDPVSPGSLEHIRLVRAFFPQLPVVCTNPLPPALGLIGRGPVYFLPKPFAPEQLAAMLDTALEQAASPF
jgi:DNA-binding NtrC family response regulator